MKPRIAGAVVCMALGAAAPGGACAARYVGTYAFIGGTPAVRSVLQTKPSRNPLQLALDFTQTAPNATAPIRTYETDATKKMHLVVVSDDFNTFVHVHPQLGSDGHFRYRLTLPRAAVYYFYADSTPQGRGRQVFRFTVPAGRVKLAAVPPVLPAAADAVRAGPYAVHLSRVSLAARRPNELTAVISKNGRTATDLHAYLGNAAHVVLLNVASLAYAHVHPMLGRAGGGMDMSGEGMGGTPDTAAGLAENAPVPGAWALHVGPLPAGTYVAWIEFRGGSRLFVAPFVIAVK